MTEISISGLGVTALNIHSKGKKHSLKCPANSQAEITFAPLEKDSEKGNNDPKENSKMQTTIDSLLIRENTVAAEIRWALESLMSSYSYNSCSSKTELFSAMFSDSNIAEQFSMGKTKCAYYITHGIAPYFKRNFMDSLKQVPFYAVSFDESYNKAIKQGQMDLHIRYWDIETDRVKVQYLDSSFMGKSSAKDVFEHFKSCTETIDDLKLLQVYSDGPNVNLAFLNLLNESRSESELSKLLDIGTCSLHSVHNAFQHGEKASNWNIKKHLSAMSKIFYESPSRRSDYEKLTSSTKADFPLPFCTTRWTENAKVAKKAQEVWQKMLQLLDFWKGLPKSKQPGQGKQGGNKSYETLLSHKNDPLILVKLRFFEEIANNLNEFLVRFQTSAPMLPFLVDSLESLTRNFAERLILPDVLEKANNTYNLCQIDFTDKNIQKPLYEVSFGIDHDLRILKKEGKVTDSKINAFKVEAKMFVAKLCSYIIEKSPLNSYFARSARSISPINLAEIPDACEKRFQNLLKKLVDTKQIPSTLADKAKQEFRKFKSNIVRENKAIFRNYDIDKNQLDEFYSEYLKDNAQYESFYYVIKIVLTMFHGQADVERGFSVNKNLTVENMSEESLIAQRFVKDHMKSKNFQPHSLPIPKEMLKSVKEASSLYRQSLKEKKESQQKQEKDKRLLEIDEELIQLNRKRSSLEEAIKEYHLERDKYALDAEKKENLELLKMSNGFKRAASEKEAELEAVMAKRKCLEDKRKKI